MEGEYIMTYTDRQIDKLINEIQELETRLHEEKRQLSIILEEHASLPFLFTAVDVEEEEEVSELSSFFEELEAQFEEAFDF